MKNYLENSYHRNFIGHVIRFGGVLAIFLIHLQVIVSRVRMYDQPYLGPCGCDGVYNELYEKFSKNYDSPFLSVFRFDAWSSVMDIDMNWKNNCFVISGSCTPSNGNVGNHYKYYYTVVYRANDVINNIDMSSKWDDEKARLKAECKFLRAWAYYHLNVLWRGVLSIWKMWRVRKQPKRAHRKLRYGSKFFQILRIVLMSLIFLVNMLKVIVVMDV